MRVTVFSSKPYDREFLEAANRRYGYDLRFIEPRLGPDTAGLGAGADAVCLFVNDHADGETLARLARDGTRVVALRCAGYNNVDLAAARALDLTVVRVPAYSPYAVAEHAVALILSLNRKIHRAYSRVRDGNFALDGLLGFDLHGRTVGIVGTGRIGTVFARIMAGFGCRLLGVDPAPNDEARAIGVVYVPLVDLLGASDIIVLHCPLTLETHHLIDADALARMRRGVMLVNTSRGAVVDTRVVIGGLKSGRIGSLGIDVYEEEADVFFEDLSSTGIDDDVLARLLTFPNVIVTGHQGFFTRDALERIAGTTLDNLSILARGERCGNEIRER